MLADRVGIIDHGRIVAEGHACGAEGRDRPSERRGRTGESRRPLGDRGRPRALRRADRRDAERSRGPAAQQRRRPRRRRPRARRRGPRARPPPAARADARRRLPREDGAHARGCRRGVGRARAGPRVTAYALQVAHLGQRSVMRTARQPANIVFALVFPLALLAVNSGGLEPRHRDPRVPDRLVRRVRAGGAVRPGRALLDDERRHRPRPGHPDRLPRPSRVDADAGLRADRGTARRGRHPRVRPGRRLRHRRSTRRRRLRHGVAPASPSSWGLRRSTRSASARSARCSRSGPAPARRSRATSRSSSPCSSSRR